MCQSHSICCQVSSYFQKQKKNEQNNSLFRELYQNRDNLTVEQCKERLKLVWKHLTGKSHEKCPDDCPWKIDPAKEPILRTNFTLS